MKPVRRRAFDVVVIDATGDTTTHAYALQRDLVARGLRVKLDVVPRTIVSPTPVDVFDDAHDTTYCVLFLPVNEGDRTEIAFIAVPAPSKPGAIPKFVAHATSGESDAVEVGRLRGDVSGLASRVAERVQMLNSRKR
jgi:hypothetical protein